MNGPANGRPGPVNRQRAEVVREALAERRRTHDYWIRAELEAELRDGEKGLTGLVTPGEEEVDSDDDNA